MSELTEFSVDNSIYSIPEDRHYARETHMWAKYDSTTGQVKVGIDALGLTALGDLAYVTLFPVGTVVKRGMRLGTLEAAKMTGGLESPVGGEIVALNGDAVRNPALVNQTPYSAGWLVILQPDDWQTESQQLISGDRLPEWVKSEIERYRDQGWIDR